MPAQEKSGKQNDICARTTGQCAAAARERTVAVIVTYNRKELLNACIRAVLRQKNCSCDVLVMDNASTDGTADLIRQEYGNNPHIFYQNTKKNLGGAGGFARGALEALKRGYEYLWLMDDDTIPAETALEELLAAGKKLNGDWGFLSSAAYWTDGSICRANIQKKTIFRHVGRHAYEKDYERIRMCSFVSLLLKASVVKEIGVPLEEYFIWTDDYEYTGRISTKYSGYMAANSKVVHAMQKNRRADFAAEEGERLERYWYLFRNDVHCYRRYGLYGWLYLLAKNLYTAAGILLRSKGDRRRKFQVLCSGFKAGLVFHPAAYGKESAACGDIR